MPLIPKPLLAEVGAKMLSAAFETTSNEQEEDELRLSPLSSKKHHSTGPVIRINEGAQAIHEFPTRPTMDATYAIPMAKIAIATEHPTTDVQMGLVELSRSTVAEEGTETTAPPTT